MELKRIWNPPNPYLTEHRELLGEAPPADMEVYEDESKTILSSNDSSDLGFRWSLNPYRGCFHACSYCYARPTHEYFGLGAGTDFERKIFVKPRAPQLLEAAFRKPSWKGERIMFSGVTDCYQPLEAGWKLTQGCLQVCLKYRNPVGVVTKSLLIRRDAALLASLATEAGASVSLSIPFFDERTVRIIEPGAPTVKRRFETMRILADAGVPVGIGVAPVIPGINDADIPRLLKEAARCGAHFAFKTLLRLPGSVKQVFFHRLEQEMPLAVRKVEHRIRETRNGRLYNSRFGQRHHGEGEYWDLIERAWDVWTRRYGFAGEEDNEREPAVSAFRRPQEPKAQLEFTCRPGYTTRRRVATMSGHSKWAGIKHKKAIVDAQKGKAFSKVVREITQAAKLGGGSPDGNPRLRLAITKAREVNLPKDKIEQAIKKGTGELPGVSYEEMVTEGYGPGGVAILVQALSDNKNRTTAELRNIFVSHHGNMAGAGSVSWLFQTRGVVTVSTSLIDEDRLMSLVLDAGAEDLSKDGDLFSVTCDPHHLEPVKAALSAQSLKWESADITLIPSSTVKVENAKTAGQLLTLLDKLEEHDDVQHVYANFDIPDAILAEHASV